MSGRDRYPVPWRWEKNKPGFGDSLVAADGTEIVSIDREISPFIRVALLHAAETANQLARMHAKDFTSCRRNPDCGECDCCRANHLFVTMNREIEALQPARPKTRA